jgi:uncharacterized protein (TIGR03382 family)
MNAWVWVIIVVAILAAVAVAVFAWLQARRRRLHKTFGPEYERALADAPTRREAEAELEDRRKRREELEIRPLASDAAQRYQHEWEGVQVRFVDDPVGATRDADRLVQQVMSERGYPMDDFESRADLISVDHPTVVENYRQAHSAYVAYDKGDASTEDLRQAMVHYRSLFDELVRTDERAYQEVR